MKFTLSLVNEVLFKAVQMVLGFGSSIFMYFCTETSHSQLGNIFCHSPAKLDNNIFPTQNLSFTSILCPHEDSTLTLKYYIQIQSISWLQSLSKRKMSKIYSMGIDPLE